MELETVKCCNEELLCRKGSVLLNRAVSGDFHEQEKGWRERKEQYR